MTQRHKHADLMIAYANDTSIEIEYHDPKEGRWVEVDEPSWFKANEYRIKPKKGDFICEIDGTKWYLGPEAPQAMTWDEAKEWAKEQGCFLPPREVLLMCYIKEDIRKQFKQEWYWSMDEYKDNPAGNAWIQGFGNGYQDYNSKSNTYYVRGVFCEGLK